MARTAAVLLLLTMGGVAMARAGNGGTSPVSLEENHPAPVRLAALRTGSPAARPTEIYASPQGNDRSPGTRARPVSTLARAQQLARAARARGGPVTVILRGGTYYLPAPLVFTAADSGAAQAPVVYQAYPQETPVISGGTRLTNLHWTPYQNGILQTPVPADLQTDQLFVNGERQILARYPNYDPHTLIFGGSAADATSPERAARWADPAGGYIHAMHQNMWGDFWYRITGNDAAGHLTYEGGWQNNRPAPMHRDYRYVENIFEELDSPGEWFLNPRTHTLYYEPPAGLNLAHAVVEAPRLRTLIELHGTEQAPVRFVSFRGLTFRHTLRTFMDNREPLLRSDWTIDRAGTVLFDGAEDCSLEASLLDQPGGNAIFLNNYNRRITVRGCHINRAGSNGVAIVGDPKAVRSPLFQYDQRQDIHSIDMSPGPKTNNYPADCLVEDCLIHGTGQFEKQTAPVEIDMAQDITVRHCSLYDVPRAGINIGDGCWGGHVVEFCDIFDTVKETGDHGSYNSWGRDRYWGLNGVDLNTAVVNGQPELPRLDAVKPIILRNNRWRCDHGWDIDLDDGSSNYVITNNLCLNGGLKNREGFYRVVENNIMVDNTYCPHVWYADSQDIFRHNIVWGRYAPAGQMPPRPWGKEMDYNLVQQDGAEGTAPATMLQRQSGRDEHSIVADAQFVDPSHGDYRVKPGSPALALGFVNFPMDQFGVQTPALKALAHTPQLPGAQPAAAAPAAGRRDTTPVEWQGASVRNIADAGEMSAYGLPGVTGVLVLKVAAGSALERAGLRPGDVILGLNGAAITTAANLQLPANRLAPGQGFGLRISRNQHEQTLRVTPSNRDLLTPHFPPGTRILFQGDSITDGGRGRNEDPNHILGQDYAYLIAANCGGHYPDRDWVFLNRGISGNTVLNLAARWQTDTLDLHPDILSILVGVNDAASAVHSGGQGGVTAALYEQTFDQLLQQTVAANPKVRLVLCEPFIAKAGHVQDQLDAWTTEIKLRQAAVERLAAKYHAPVVHFQRMFDAAIAGSRQPVTFWIWDGVHPTYAGHQLMADEWIRTVNAFYFPSAQ